MNRRVAFLLLAFAFFPSAVHAADGPAKKAEPPRMKNDVSETIMMMDGFKDQRCGERKVVKTEVVESKSGAPSVERWVMDRCGKPVSYSVKYTRNAKGGTDFSVQMEK